MPFDCRPPLVLCLAALSACESPNAGNADAGNPSQSDATVDAATLPGIDAGPSLRPGCELLMSASTDRSNPQPVSGVPPAPVYFFLSCDEPEPSAVSFWLDDPLSSLIISTQQNAPFDLMTSLTAAAEPMFALNYPSDTYTLSAGATTESNPELILFFQQEFEIAGLGEPVWMVSDSPNRSDARVLEGESLTASSYIHLRPGSRRRGEFEDVQNYLDGNRVQVEDRPPFDLLGGSNSGPADEFDPSQYSSGLHQIEARVMTPAGLEIFASSFTIP